MREQGSTTSRHPAASDLLAAIGIDRDRTAFAALFTFYAPRLAGYFRRLGADAGVAEELVQDVMLTIWQRAGSYDQTKGGASTWIFAIARNKRIDAFRRERRPTLDPNDPLLAPEDDPTPEKSAETAETRRLIGAALANLPADQRMLLHMWYYDDKSHHAIAAARNIPLGTVKARLRRALARLRLDIAE